MSDAWNAFLPLAMMAAGLWVVFDRQLDAGSGDGDPGPRLLGWKAVAFGFAWIGCGIYAYWDLSMALLAFTVLALFVAKLFARWD
jgi:hypothetical protein